MSHTLQRAHTHTLTKKHYSKPQPEASPAQPACILSSFPHHRQARTDLETCCRSSAEHSPDSAFMGMFDVWVHKEQSVNPTPKNRQPTVFSPTKMFVQLSARARTCSSICIQCGEKFLPLLHIKRITYSLSMFGQL